MRLCFQLSTVRKIHGLSVLIILVESEALSFLIHTFSAIMGRITELTDGDFDTIIVQSKLPVLVDFWSPTCAPCRMLVPVLEELADDNEGDATIAKVNTAQYPALVSRYGIDTLPTLLLFYQGKVVERMVGVQPKHKLQSALDEID